MDAMTATRLPTAPEWLQRHHRQMIAECRAAYAAIAERDGITVEQAKARFWFSDKYAERGDDSDIDRGGCEIRGGMQREGL